ncbi:MAG: ribonuclease E activity regulator RraA [Burkholderiales bacterium]|jgi:regulator of ribonuclease activity A|nr:ribonuclease E activity regulator RraA [Burkholderiales bacterium]MCA3229084.1 ribonuclease E activity regulator RraA [Burkholderiales bacterium]
MDVAATADLADAFEPRFAAGTLAVLGSRWLCMGRRFRFGGSCVTLQVFEDNSLVADEVKAAGQGRVLVVDGGGSLRCALFGGNLARAAQEHGWAGVVIHGAARDADEIDSFDVGVRALALSPRRAIKRGAGQRDLPLLIEGVRVQPGDWIYADRDGVLVSRAMLVLPAGT